MIGRSTVRITKFKLAAGGALISIVIVCGLFLFVNSQAATELLLYETLPFFNPDLTRAFAAVDLPTVGDLNVVSYEPEETSIPQQDGGHVEETSPSFGDGLLGIDDVVVSTEERKADSEHQNSQKLITASDSEELAKLRDMNELKKQFYIVENETAMTPDWFNVDNFLAEDLSIAHADGPVVLIFHTHGREAYIDSEEGVPEDGVIGVGSALARVLSEKYDIKCLHMTQSFDTQNGKSMVTGAYERMEPVVKNVLSQYPSIQVLIDIHRDAVGKNEKLLTKINGVDTARIMFVNGLTRLYNDRGVLENIRGLTNPYMSTNLAFSFKMQLAANELYPNFSRKIYLKAYRYSLNMMPKSVLVEVGAQTNTKAEAQNSAEPLADIIAAVVKPK